MSFSEIARQFIEGIKATSLLEFLAVFSGIASVWFSKKENMLVYPVGLINTIFYVYLSCKGDLWGEATVNLYYTIMSFYGWYQWTKRDQQKELVLHISKADSRQWSQHLFFFVTFYVIIYFALQGLKKDFAPGAIPWADALASASAFTGMWLMTRKKLESWYWWIITNITSIPLYFVKGYVFTSVYYIVLLVMSLFGLAEWNKKIKEQQLHGSH